MNTTHEVFNQPEPLVDVNLFDGNRPMQDALKFNAPFTISPEALLDEAQKAFKEHKVDTLSVSENGKQLGMLDIQDLMKAIAG